MKNFQTIDELVHGAWACSLINASVSFINSLHIFDSIVNDQPIYLVIDVLEVMANPCARKVDEMTAEQIQGADFSLVYQASLEEKEQGNRYMPAKTTEDADKAVSRCVDSLNRFL